MFRKNVIIFLVLLNSVFINLSLGQNRVKIKTFNQENFDKNKILDEMYQLRWYKNMWMPNNKDTLSYFVDDRNYKGIINYGVTFRSRDFKSYEFSENKSMCFLNVEISKCNYSQKDSIINIEGFVSSNLNEIIKKGNIENSIEIFLGEKIDTSSTIYFGNACYFKIIKKDIVELTLHNKEIDEFTSLDVFPAFYLKEHTYYRTSPKGRQPFKISGKVTKNTLLAFGSMSHYSEIFDLTSMVYYPNKNSQKKIAKERKSDCKTIMIDNKIVLDTNKKTKNDEDTYYTYTQTAEDYIITRQYAKAKEQYSLLSLKYPALFARDIHNAFRCAILSRDFKTAFWWGEKLAFKGIDLSYFNSRIFDGIKKKRSGKILASSTTQFIT